MKNILTLLVSLMVVTAAFAQRDEARRVILGGDNRTVYSQPYPQHYPGSYPGAYPRERRINEINRDYDARIFSVRTDPGLSRHEKKRIIWQLERERRERINAVNSGYYDRGWGRDDDDWHFKNHRDRDRDDNYRDRDHDDHGNWHDRD